MHPTRLFAQQAASLVRRVPAGGTPSPKAVAFLDHNPPSPALTAAAKVHVQAAAKPKTKAAAKPYADGPISGGRPLLKKIGRCLEFGCNPQQTADAAALVRAIPHAWPKIQMTLARCCTHEDAVYKGALLKRHENGPEGPLLPWRGISRRSQLSQAAFQAATRFLDYSLATANPEGQELWRTLRDLEAKPSGNRTSRLTVTNFWLTDYFKHIVSPQIISAYPKLKSYNFSKEYVVLNLFVAIWSNTYMLKVADANIHVSVSIGDLAPNNRKLLGRELDRITVLGFDPVAYAQARLEKKDIVSGIEKLVKETVEREGAVEDLGSASGA